MKSPTERLHELRADAIAHAFKVWVKRYLLSNNIPNIPHFNKLINKFERKLCERQPGEIENFKLHSTVDSVDPTILQLAKEAGVDAQLLPRPMLFVVEGEVIRIGANEHSLRIASILDMLLEHDDSPVEPSEGPAVA